MNFNGKLSQSAGRNVQAQAIRGRVEPEPGRSGIRCNVIKRWPALFATALWLGLFTACITQDNQPKRAAFSPSGNGDIDEINLLAGPVALNFDQSPGPDGFVLKIYANSRKEAKPVAIEGGKVEVLMFDSTPNLDGSGLGQPRRTWNFTAQDLKRFEIHSSIGIGYQLLPIWKEAAPTGDKFTIIVRYVSPKGTTIISAPSIISLGVR